MLQLSLDLIWRYTAGGRGRVRLYASLGKLIAQGWSANWLVTRRKPSGEIWWMLWLLVFFVCSSGLSPQKLSFLECAAQWRASCPSSAALLWAQILPMCVALCPGEESVLQFESTTNLGADRTGWEMLMTEKGGRRNSSTRLVDVLVSAVDFYYDAKSVSSWRRGRFITSIKMKLPVKRCLVCISVLQVTLRVTIVASVNLAGPDQTVTRGKPPWYGRTSIPWPLKSWRSSWMFWSWPRPPSTLTMLLPPSTGWDSWDQMELSHSLPTSPSMTSLCGNITTQSETLS